jgi:hypothetical protein
LNALLRLWEEKSIEVFASIEHPGADTRNQLSRSQFNGLSVIVLEARWFDFPSSDVRAKTDGLLAQFLGKFEAHADTVHVSPEYLDLIFINLMTRHDFDPFTFDSYQNIRAAAINLQASINNAFSILHNSAFKRSVLFDRLRDYFRHFFLVNTWPRLQSFEEVASIETPIAVFFTVAPGEIVQSESFNYDDVMSLILSR